MGKKYYCDYCDRSLPNGLEARKVHISGTYHQKMISSHYHNFKSAREKLCDEKAKTRCQRFSKYGHCSYGDSCCYSHLQEEDIRNLEFQANLEEKMSLHKQIPSQLLYEEPNLQKWFLKQATMKNQLPESNNCIPPSLQPPSLQPPSLHAIAASNFQVWG